MSHALARKTMDRVLKELVIPRLRAAGFRGSFPHFRRTRAGRLDLLSFQFYSNGGSFVVELGQCDEGGFTTSWGEFVAPNKVNVTYVPDRLRLGSDSQRGQSDHWFVFDRPNYDAPLADDDGELERNCRLAAESVLTHLDAQAEQWWSSDERRLT